MNADKFKIVNRADEAEITLYESVDPWFGISAAEFRDQLQTAKNAKTIRLRINSSGGSVFDGTAIYNMLKSHPARKIVQVDGLAASIASIIAMAGDEIIMGEGAYMMIHDPTGVVVGTAEDMADMADVMTKIRSQLAGIYSRRTGRDEADILRMMSDETWLTADEAIAEKFADRSIAGLKLAASCGDVSRFKNVPQALKGRLMSEPKPATLAELKAALPDAPADFLVAQLEAEATIEQAAVAWAQHLASQNTQLAEENQRLKSAAKSGIGVDPLPDGGRMGRSGGSAAADFEDAVRQVMDERKVDRRTAHSIVCHADPELRRAVVVEANQRAGRGEAAQALLHDAGRV